MVPTIVFRLGRFLFLPLLAIFASLCGTLASQPTPVHLQETGNSELLPVALLNLDKLEPTVANQIRAFQLQLQETIAAESVKETLAESYGVLGQLYQLYEFKQLAQACYINATMIDPDDFRWHYRLGYSYEAAGELEEALKTYNLVRRLKPEYVAASIRSGDICLQLGHIDEARQHFVAARKSSPNSAAALYGSGRAALAKKQYVEAVGHLENALRIAPGANRIHYTLAMAKRGLGEFEQARYHLSQLGQILPAIDDPLFNEMYELAQGERIHIIRGKHASNLGHFERAEEAFSKALEANPESADAHVELGVLRASLGKTAEAMNHFREAMKLDPTSTTAAFNLGVLLSEDQQFEAAITQFRAALQIDPANTETLNQLALTLAKAGHKPEAIDVLFRAVALDPDHEASVLDLAGRLEQSKRFKEARAILDRSNRDFPKRTQTALALARLLAACPVDTLRDGPRATMLARAVCGREESPRNLEVLAMALAECGHFDQAVEVQRDLYKMAISNGRTDIARQLLIALELYQQDRPFRAGNDEDSK